MTKKEKRYIWDRNYRIKHGDEYKKKKALWDKNYRMKNKEKLKEKQKKYRINNIGKIKNTKREYYLKNKGSIKAKVEKWALDNRERLIKNRHKYYIDNINEWKEYAIKNKDRLKKYRKERRIKYIDKFKIAEREWRLKNKNHIREYNNKHHSDRIKNDINYRLRFRLRGRIWKALKGKNKSATTMELIGCSFDELKQYLELKFKPGMSWENYGKNGWAVDHIIPCAFFDLTDRTEQKICFHYSNLQPLWEKENYDKRAKIA